MIQLTPELQAKLTARRETWRADRSTCKERDIQVIRCRFCGRLVGEAGVTMAAVGGREVHLNCPGLGAPPV
jgi:hypothetical protein